MAETDTTSSSTTPTAPGLVGRIFGVLVSPRQTYAAVAVAPRALGVFIVTLAVTAGAQSLFFSTDVGKEMLLDQQVRTIESFGVTITDEMYERMESSLDRAQYTAPLSQLVSIPLMAALIAGLLVGIYTMLLGGTATFKQVFAIIAHSSVIIAVQQLFSMPLSYASGEFAGAHLAVFVPMLEETSFATRFLGAIDLFVIWWAINLAIGIGVLYKRRTGGIATGLIAIYVLIALILAIVRSGS